MRLLTFATLYPSSSRPTHGVFVENRLRRMLAHGGFSATVVAPVPWFPSTDPKWGTYAVMARTPREEARHGVRVLYPRYLSIPKVGMSVAPFLLAAAMVPVLRRVIAEDGPFDVIDAHYLYPEGVAAVMLGLLFRLPVVLTARGSDVNLFPKFAVPGKLIRWAVDSAAATVTVSKALRDSLLALGAQPERVAVMRNGVDLEMFAPDDRGRARASLGCTRYTVLSVGNLKPDKGHDVVVEALSRLPDSELIIAGGGDDRGRLEGLAARVGVADRVRFVGVVPHDALRQYYEAADILVLASVSEGWPNVLLEAMACGTPVVATAVGGVLEIVQVPEAGRIISERTPQAVAEAVTAVREARVNRVSTRGYAEKFGWEPTVEGLHGLFSRVLGTGAA